jgi:hypothetical protein
MVDLARRQSHGACVDCDWSLARSLREKCRREEGGDAHENVEFPATRMPFEIRAQTVK